MTSLPIQTGMNGRFFPNNWRSARDEIAFARSAGFGCIQFPGPEAGLDADRLGDSLETVAYLRPLLRVDFRGPAILEIGGAPWSGGFGQDTDAALIDSNWRLRQAVRIALGQAVAGEE